MHNPRGSNNRNCRNDNGENRRTNNRLFDSQNNDKGGYSCPRAYPFPATSNAGVASVVSKGIPWERLLWNGYCQNGLSTCLILNFHGFSQNEYGDIVSSTTNNHVDTDTFFYYAGTDLMVIVFLILGYWL